MLMSDMTENTHRQVAIYRELMYLCDVSIADTVENVVFSMSALKSLRGINKNDCKLCRLHYL